MRTTTGAKAIAVAGAVMLSGLLFPASPAAAKPAQEARLSGAVLSFAAERGDQVLATAKSNKSRAAQSLSGAQARVAKSAAKVQAFLDQQARSGRLLDDSDVKVATVADPLQAGKDVTVAWSGPVAPSDVALQKVGNAEEGGAQGVGVYFGGADAQAADASAAAGGSGFTAGTNPKNMYKYSNDCVTVWFDAGYSTSDHQLISCFEKWAQSGTNHWVYNRWGLWTRAAGTAKTVDFTIRSRPWKTTLNQADSFVYKLNSWKPTGPTNTCNTQTYSIGGEYKGVMGTISVPITTCQHYYLKVDTAQKMIGIGFEANSEPGRQIRLDAVGDYLADDNRVVPVWADYSYAKVQYPGPQGTTRTDEKLQKDSGW